MCWKLHTLTSVVVDNFNIVRIALPEGKANPPAGVHRHRPLTRSIPLEFMESYAFERTEICRVLATFKADSRSTAAAKSKPRNWLGVSPRHTLRLAALRHDRIMAETYYAER